MALIPLKAQFTSNTNQCSYIDINYIKITIVLFLTNKHIAYGYNFLKESINCHNISGQSFSF